MRGKRVEGIPNRLVAFLGACVLVVCTSGARAQSAFCGFDRLMAEIQKSDPATYQQIVNLERSYSTQMQQRAAGQAPAPQRLQFPDTIYLVVHVIHLGEPVGSGSNISDNQIIATINEVNKMYAGVYGGVNTNIVFALACEDPNGIPTTGIVRANGSGLPGYSAGGVTNDAGCSGAWWTDVINLSPQWNPNRYVNVYVAHELDCGSRTAGWSYLPTGVADQYDVVFVKDDYFTPADAFVLGHELGHYLGLYHTFQGDNGGAQCPPNANCSTDGDGVCDTAPHMYNDCDTTNDCGYNSQPMWDNTRFNYMSYCHIYGNTLSVFTQGQSDRMEWFLLNAGDRNQLLAYNPPCALTNCSITIAVDGLDTACVGSANGAAYVTVTGCQGNCYYLWSNGATTQDLLGVPPGTYILQVTDDQGCVARDTVDVPAWPVISATASITYPSCPSCSDGAIDITVSGGVPPYSYLWSTGATTQDISGIDTGTYIVTITDAKGCTRIFTYNVDLRVPCKQIPLEVYYWDTVPSANLHGFIWPINRNFGCYDTFSIDYADIAFIWFYDALTDSVYDRTLFDSIRIDTVGAYILHSHGAGPSQYDTIIFELYANVVSPLSLLWSHDTIVNTSLTGDTLMWYAVPVGITVPATDTPILRITMQGSTLDTLYLVAWYEDRCAGNCWAAPSIFPTTTRYWLNYPGFCNYFTDLYLYVDCNGNNQMDAGSCELFPLQYWAAGISATATTMVTTGPPVVTVDSVVNVSCAGGSDGAIYVSVSGGEPPLTYLWTPGNYTAEDITGLSAGTYTLVVTDACGRSDTFSVAVSEPLPLVIDSFSKQDPSACGAADGSARVHVSGGTPPYSYQWSSGHTTVNATGLGAGTYQVIVTDANGCQVSGQVTLSEPSAPTATYTKGDVSCAGGSDGWIKVIPSGGTPPYTHRWNPVPPNASASGDSIWGLSAGVWTDTIIDAGGCRYILQVTIAEPPALSVTVDNIDSVSCAGGSDGAIYITVGGGTPPYWHRWSNGATSEDLTGVRAGSYTDTITDARGCVLVAGPYTVGEPPQLAVALDGVDSVSCAGGSDGAIYITVGGGTPPYWHRWSNGATTEDLTGIPAGTYTDTITDAKGCVMIAGPYTVGEPPQIMATVDTIISASCRGGTDGAIYITVSGGILPYTHRWSNGATTEDLTGIPAGTYTDTITDANGCMTVAGPYTVREQDVPCGPTALEGVAGAGSDVECVVRQPEGTVEVVCRGVEGERARLLTPEGRMVAVCDFADDNVCRLRVGGRLPAGVYYLLVEGREAVRVYRLVLEW